MTNELLNSTSMPIIDRMNFLFTSIETGKVRSLFSIGLLGAMVAFSSPAFAAQLTKDQLSNQIIGKTLTTKRMGMKVRIFYSKDGGVTMKMPLMSGKGTWKFNGDQICMNMKSGPKRGKTCLSFEHVKANKYRNSEGVVLSVGQ